MERRNLYGRRLCKVYLLWVIACTSMLYGCVLCLNEEGQVLFKWKQDFLKDADDSLSNWNASDNTPCLWNGVKCNQDSVIVLDFSPLYFCHLVGDIHALTPSKFVNLTTLNVGNTSLSGNLPEDIVNCSKLTNLNLSLIHIGGKFPNDFYKLQHLQVLDLTGAYFKGTVENKFDELQELQVLRLGWNYFEGQMPNSILSLMKLKELALSHNNWNGTLPLGFFTIPNLKVLWLGSDLDVWDMVPWPNVSLWEGLEELRLHGVNFPPSLFPTGILTLTKLRTLNLERCHIIGPIPSLESLPHLEELNLGNNSLSGHIPDMFGSMPNLTVLWLYTNQLTGPLPPSLLQCNKLWQLIAFSNGLSGDLASLTNLKGSLTWLDIGINNFSGKIPASLGNMTLLTFFALSSNNFSGKIPLIWESLPRLTLLDLSVNHLSGQMPPMLGTLSLLTYLSLNTNNLSGQIPPIWRSLPLLTHLDLGLNQFSGPIPPEIADLEQLAQLNLQRNQLNGEIPYDLGRKALLQRVDIGHNLFEGPIPPYLCWGNNVSLQFLGLYENKLIGTIPKTYDSCTNLSVLRLDGNQLEGPVPASFWGGVNLVRMQLSGNRLNGSIDARIGNAKSLSILLVQDNQFSGPIPTEIGQTNLVKFQANSNKFNDTLTPSLGNLSRLTQLVLGANSFYGAIPTSLGNCSELFQLDLSKNNLDGTIPDELAHLNKLSILDVSENDLMGTIPVGLFNMVNLQTLNVAFNNLSGIIPTEGNGITFMTVNFSRNPYLCLEGLCGSNSSTQGLASKGGRKQSWMVLVDVFSVVGFMLFVIFALVFRSCIDSTLWRDILHLHEDESSWTLTSFHNKVYREDEVMALEEKNLIGSGSSGQVYKVTLSDGEIVAIKKLWNVKKEEGRCDHGFGTELKTVANIRHRHIVKLLCSCTKGDNNLLVYEYMPNGSLGDLLHGPKTNPLPWKIRYKIAMEAALGLEYLHHDCSPQILHQDVKSKNILLDLEYKAHLADFRIARMVDPVASLDLSLVVGSIGYIPPEYSFGTRVTEKIDIYSFGVVLMELVTGKRATDPLEDMDGASLVQWIHSRVLTPKGLYETLDSKCGTNSQSEMVQVLQVGMLCTNYTPKNRPSMREVVKMLRDIGT